MTDARQANLLFCANDAGGARNLAPVAKLAKCEGWPITVLASPATVPLFAELGVDAEALALGDGTQALSFLHRICPTALICGTTRYLETEGHLIVAARELGIPSLSVLDEWYGYRQRFADRDGTLTYLPDRVCCQNAQAVAEASAEGLPSHRLVITGSPALANLAARISSFAERPPALPPAWQGANAGCRLLFISETHADDYGSKAGAIGPLGPYLGYNEYDVRLMLAENIAVLSSVAISVVEKLHPSAESNLPQPPAGLRQTWTVVARQPLWPYLFHADLVVGMRSMALLEAALMGSRPLALQPGLIGPDRCTATRLGMADAGRDATDLCLWLEKALHKNRRSTPPCPDFATSEAPANILRLCCPRAFSVSPDTNGANVSTP